MVDVLWHNLTTSLLFYHYLSNYHKINDLRHILTLPPSFLIFFGLDFKIKISLTYFGVFPYFLHFLCVSMWLMFSDIIWPPPFFFYHSLSLITRSIVSDIYWPFPLIFTFFVLLSKLNALRHILTLPPHFYIFCLIIKIKCSLTYFDNKQMLEKAFCSNIAPSLSSGTHLFYNAEYMGRSYIPESGFGITFDWSALAT